MELPKTSFDQEIYQHIKSVRRDQKSYMMCDLEHLGEGAAGTTYTAYLKPKKRFPTELVLKEQRRNRFCLNEFEALRFLRDEMVAERLPGYFVFMYGCFTSGNKKYIIMEKVDCCLDDYLATYNINTKTYLQIFYNVARAVDYLEKLRFNHGDLWVENVMIKWDPEQEDLDEIDRDFSIKIIDFDSAYKENSQITNPSLGGGNKFRKRFYLGYDLNRFFDSLLYSYTSFIKKKLENKKRKIARMQRLRKRGKNVHVPTLSESDSSDKEFDVENIIYPPAIIKFMQELKPVDPEKFSDRKDLSGKVVIQKILDYASELGIDLYGADADSSTGSDAEADIGEE